MVVLQADSSSAWLRRYYEQLRAAGKPGKLAFIAALPKLLAAVGSLVRIFPAPYVVNDA